MLIGCQGRNHRQQVGKRGALDKVDDRRTPRDLWGPLNERHRFTIDVAASRENALCPMYYTVEDDGLAMPWSGHSVWCNPPFSDCGAWVAKAWDEWDTGALTRIVMLLPGNRTEQGWWQTLVEPFRDRGYKSPLETEFLAGRLRFDVPADTYSDPRGNRPPFGCVLLTWKRLG